ncbi:Tyrosine-protein phosphatase [Zhongshania aliphaticivorans]|uniref:Tyrosine-protein phosphatase n=1 Tax=Zhongshania aliphaticivorans TaxID=1470434 RepID=A0A5S9NFJ2_9GAMM|nr:tyrosine-protein phosphatase [Zhongshania aliphaticivorans]CAA0089182.1 Tyrosine-protein phosphatase [Zhongshania aliphaticivorans]CAA0095858.1 Tyrosine-protein phosphatase [Zhongshania aliphaticivorans]
MNAIDLINSIPSLKPDSIPAASRVIPASLPAAQRELARKLHFDGMHNFRDIGGYQTHDNRQVRWGMVYRADKFSSLSEEDKTFIQNLGIAQISDFRSTEECRDSPHNLPQQVGIRVNSLPIAVDAAQIERITARLQQENATADDIAHFLIEANREMIERFTPVYKQWLQTLLNENNYPHAFHCTAGKDRTGLAAALLMQILGVRQEAILQDYLATNTYTAERVNHIVHFIHEQTMHQVNKEVIRTLFTVQAHYLGEAFTAIDEEYGNLENYIEVALGIGQIERLHLQALLLEPLSQF